MYSLEMIIALNQKAALKEQQKDKETIERVLRNLDKGNQTPATQALAQYLAKQN